MDKTKIGRLPDSPGVYIFKNKEGSILYIGKAGSLKKRVKYYFTHPLPLKTQIMASKIAGVDYIITKSEAEARIKEAKLIKENLPPYNTVSRDDKSFPLICITEEEFPTVWIARRTSKKLINSSSRCFGPYTNAGLLRQAIKTIRGIFGFRSCWKMPKRACLYYRLGLCPAPCIGKITKREYRESIKNIIMFLEGRRQDLINKLAVRMRGLSSKQRFEEAGRLRNQIQALSSISEESVSSLSDLYRESEDLKKALGLTVRPQRIEAFDVSNIFGSEACASMVSFYEGKPDKNNYRRFRIKSVTGIDDFQMLKEAVYRRYRRVIKENLPLPDLIVVDGGKGQLNIAERQIQELGLRVPVISIAKQKEEIFVPRRQEPVRLKPGRLALFLIQRIRDESHRFALAYHHILRRKKALGR
ncbi:MAG: excinuclease ABC subunit UvrC [Candidatus Omnitrophota bacterium]